MWSEWVAGCVGIRKLKGALANGGETPTIEPPLPLEWGEFADWLDRTYPDRVLLTPSARRMLKSPEYENVAFVARSITWLATEHHETRVNGGGSLRDVTVENGIICSATIWVRAARQSG